MWDLFVEGKIMLNHNFRLIFLVLIGVILALALAYVSTQPNRASPGLVFSGQVNNEPDTPAQKPLPRPYGKIKLPAELSMSLAEQEIRTEGTPVTIIVSVLSAIPVGSGIVTLKIPPIGGEPARTEVLWSGKPSGFVTETVEYGSGVLPAGKYQFVAIFEFTPNREDAEKLTVSKSLYLDVRSTAILSSNVSFDHIKRVELWTELQDRVLLAMRPGLATADPQTRNRELALIEARDPGIIARKIAELRLSDPDVVRKIMELNRTKADVTTGSSETQNGRNGPPAPEMAAPVRKRLAEN
jgi:hypothetical protein